MHYHPTAIAIGVFLFFTLGVLGLSFYLGRKAKSAAGYFAAHGEVPWLVNGVAFAGDYLSAASFLGICGMIAFSGYDGFLYSIGFLAGWVVALFVIAEPIRRLGKYTFADAVDATFQSRGVKMAAAISTLVVSLFYLIPQMVGAGALVKPLLGLDHWMGVIMVGVVVILIVTSAGMVSTTWVQFIKGSLLVIFCTILVVMLLMRGLHKKDAGTFPREVDGKEFAAKVVPLYGEGSKIEPTGDWKKKFFVRMLDKKTGLVGTWGYIGNKDVRWHQQADGTFQLNWDALRLFECEVVTRTKDGKTLVNGMPPSDMNQLKPMGFVNFLAEGKESTGAVGPVAFLTAVTDSDVGLVTKEVIKEADGGESTVYFASVRNGEEIMSPGLSPNFKTLSEKPEKRKWQDQWNFVSLMLALFCGTASLPHILIRYYTVKDGAAARKSTVAGILTIGFFYVLTLFLGLGAMTSGLLDPTDNNMAAPLLARTFGETWFAIISAVAFTTVLGTVSGLIIAASGAVAHDMGEQIMKRPLSDAEKVKLGKWTAIVVGVIAMVLGIVFKGFNVSFLVGWAFNVAASANLPALVMLLFWKRANKNGIMAGIIVGLVSSVGWILLSADAFVNLYKLPAGSAIAPFNQPGIVTIPLGFLAIVVVSLVTPKREAIGA